MQASVSSTAREEERRRWRALVLPHFRRLESELLTATEAKVLSLRLGIVNDRALTQGQIAGRLRVSAHSVANIEKRAIAKIRKEFYVN